MSLTGIAFLICFVVGLGLALFRHPRYGLYTYLAVFYLDPHSRWWGAMLPPIRWSLIVGVVMLIATLRMPPRRGVVAWYETTPARLLMVFSIWLWLQNFWALSPADHLQASILFTKYIVLFAVIYRMMETPADVKECMFVHVAGCAYLGWLAYRAPGGGRLEGVGGPGIDEANALAMFIGTGIVCGAMLILAERRWKQWISILVMPLLLNTVVQSQSRGAMIAILCGALVLLYLKPRPYRAQFYTFALLGIVLFGIVSQDVFWTRMKTLTATVEQGAEIDSSAESRVVLLNAQLRMAADYPFGSGHRGTAVLSPRYMDAKWLTKTPDDPNVEGARSSHNTFMSALVEQGLPGAVIFVGLLLWVVRSIFVVKRHRAVAKNPKSDILVFTPALIAAAIVVFVAGNFTDYLKTEVQIWMYALLAASTRVHMPHELADTGLTSESPGAAPASALRARRSRFSAGRKSRST